MYKEVLTEEQFLSVVKEKTGKEIGKDYGFICGTHSPFGFSKGMSSASMKYGYTIWKRKPDGTHEERDVEPSEDGLKTVINFLNNTSFKIKLDKA